MSDLHARIMNIPAKRIGASRGMEMYRAGHRDARHDAAELVSEDYAALETEIERLTARVDQREKGWDLAIARAVAAEARVAEIEALVADDGYAASFQSLGQYRTALLAYLAAAEKGNAAP